MITRFLIQVWGDTMPTVHGPYDSEELRDKAAKELAAEDEGCIFGLDTYEHEGARIDIETIPYTDEELGKDVA